MYALLLVPVYVPSDRPLLMEAFDPSLPFSKGNCRMKETHLQFDNSINSMIFTTIDMIAVSMVYHHHTIPSH